MRSAAAKILDQADAAILYRAAAVLQKRRHRDVAHYIRAVAARIADPDVDNVIALKHLCDPWRRNA